MKAQRTTFPTKEDTTMDTKLNLKEFTQVCGGGRCPKVLLKKNGDALVQGAVIGEEILQRLNVPAEENVVFLPGEVIKEFIKNYSGSLD